MARTRAPAFQAGQEDAQAGLPFAFEAGPSPALPPGARTLARPRGAQAASGASRAALRTIDPRVLLVEGPPRTAAVSAPGKAEAARTPRNPYRRQLAAGAAEAFRAGVDPGAALLALP